MSEVRRWAVLLLLLVNVVAVLAPTGSRAEGSTLLRGVHVVGGKLVDEDGRQVILRGANAMDKLPSDDGDMLPDMSASDFSRLAGMGFNSVRLGTSWAAIEPAPGVYDDAYITDFLGIMDLAAEAGVAVIVDMHQDVWGHSFGHGGAPAWASPQCNQLPHVPLAEATGQWFSDYFSPDVLQAFDNFWRDGGPGATDPGGGLACAGAVQTRFVAMWAHLASRICAHPALVGYDPFNEPFPTLPPGAFEALHLSPFYDRLGAAIRGAEAVGCPDMLAGRGGGVIFFEPAVQKSAGLPSVLLRAPDPNAVYAPHLYTETMFSGGDVSSGGVTDEVVIATTQLEADALGVPMWVGEWGNLFHESARGYIETVYDLFDRYGLGSAFWHYTQGFGDGIKATPAAEDMHVRVYPEAYHGEASWTFDPTTRTFRMTMFVDPAGLRPVPSVASIVVPSRLYPLCLSQSPCVSLAATGTASHDPVTNRLTWTLPAWFVGPASLSVAPLP